MHNDNPADPPSCLRCGICCSKFQAQINREEAQHIASQLRLLPNDFIAQYTDKRWPGRETFLLIHENGACVFLEHTQDCGITSCRIHSFKPSACDTWTYSLQNKECTEGLARQRKIQQAPNDNLHV